MARSTVAAAIALALLSNVTDAAAQARIRGDTSTESAGGRIGEPASRSKGDRSTTDRAERPSGDQRSTARFALAPRVPEGRRVLFPFQMGLGWAAFGYIPAWPIVGLAHPADIMRPLDGAPTGGLQLDMEPRGAQVYVDGAYAGVVGDFSGYYRHLELAAGPHVLTIVAPGYEPLTLNVIVSPGHTATHRGNLTRAF